MKKIFSFILIMLMVMSVATSSFAIKSIPLKSIKLDKTSINLVIGKTYTLKVTLNPTNTSQKLLKFATSNIGIATVNSVGVITAVGLGKAVITVTSQSNKKITQKCTVNVSEAQASNSRVTLTYWQHSSSARDNMMKTIAYEFMQDNPDINIKMQFIPEDSYQSKLIPALATNAAPNIMQIQSGMVERLVKAKAIQPLDESVMSTATIKSDFIPATVDGLQVGGKYYGMPTDTQTIVAYWNKDLVSAAGLDAEKGPQTWDEMLAWAKKLTKTENGKMTQSGWGEKGYHPDVQAFVFTNGGKMTDSTGKYVFADDPKSIEAIKFLVDAYKVDKVYDTQFIKNWAGFRQGKVAMMLGHPAMLGNLKLTAPTVKLGIGLVPGKNGKHTTVVTSWAYVMSKNANAVAGTKWIKYLSSLEVEKRWTQQTGELPARKALLTDKDLTSDAQLSILLSSLNDSQVGTLQTGALETIWNDGYQKLILTDASFTETLKKIQDQLNVEIAKDLK
jgi:ABC-type sugar transport system, periplasmic component